jgi:hypothetical protein
MDAERQAILANFTDDELMAEYGRRVDLELAKLLEELRRDDPTEALMAELRGQESQKHTPAA